LRRVVVGDLGGEDPLAQTPRHDLGSLLVAAHGPWIGRLVPARESPGLEEVIPDRRLEMLVDPDVSHLVQDDPSSHRVHQTRAEIDPAGERISHVPSATCDAFVEVDIHGGSVKPGDLEPSNSPPKHPELR